MIIVKLKGGLGNQLFQYAAAKNLAILNQTKLLIDSSSGFSKDPYGRSFALLHFCINTEIASLDEINYFLGKSNLIRYFRDKIPLLYSLTDFKYVQEHFYHYDENVANFISNQNMYLEGYFQSERYFIKNSNTILSEFEFKQEANEINRKYLLKIKDCESVSLHVRTYDDAKINSATHIYGNPSIDYYQKAIGYIKSKINDPVFFIFSDNIDWAKNNIVIDNSKVVYISHNDIENGHEDLRLMKTCKHNIIANSSFSWWGAWLNKNKNKIVIAPKNWVQSSQIDCKDVLPKNWIKF
jgi:hypothetical protein